MSFLPESPVVMMICSLIFSLHFNFHNLLSVHVLGSKFIVLYLAQNLYANINANNKTINKYTNTANIITNSMMESERES